MDMKNTRSRKGGVPNRVYKRSKNDGNRETFLHSSSKQKKRREMCLTFFYLNPDPKEGTFSLIVVFNRDEFFNRETEPAAWKDGILAGRDMASGKEGGTWLAMSRDGKLGCLTNISTGVAVQGEGRGFLIGDYLSSQGT